MNTRCALFARQIVRELRGACMCVLCHNDQPAQTKLFNVSPLSCLLFMLKHLISSLSLVSKRKMFVSVRNKDTQCSSQRKVNDNKHNGYNTKN